MKKLFILLIILAVVLLQGLFWWAVFTVVLKIFGINYALTYFQAVVLGLVINLLFGKSGK